MQNPASGGTNPARNARARSQEQIGLEHKIGSLPIDQPPAALAVQIQTGHVVESKVQTEEEEAAELAELTGQEHALRGRESVRRGSCSSAARRRCEFRFDTRYQSLIFE